MSRFSGGGTKPSAERKRLFTTFAFLVAKQGATAVLGLAYWILATRLYASRDVGLAAAAASLAAFLAAIGVLGIPILLLAELSSLEDSMRRTMFTTGLAIASAVVLVLSVVAMALSPFLGKSLAAIGNDPVTAALFVAGTVATVATITFDNAATGLHIGSAQLTRGTLAGVLKALGVGLLVIAGMKTSAGLLLAWAAALAASVAVCFPLLRLRSGQRRDGSLRKRMALARRYGMLSFNHHVLNLSINSISYIVPLIAALLIPPQQVAYFTSAFLLSATVLIIPYLLALALFAEKAGDEELLHRHVRRTLPIGMALCFAIVVVVELVAPLALRIFGPAYSANGATALRLLVLVGPSYVVKDHYVAIRRAQGRLASAARVMALGTSVEAVGAAVGGALWGMTGLCVGWALAASGEALALSTAVLSVFHGAPLAGSDRSGPAS